MKTLPKILLFGKNGQVGWELQRSLSPLGQLIALDSHSTNYCGNFTNLQGLAATVRVLRPDIIVNAAAHTNVDKAESEPTLARTINALAPAVLAEAAEEIDAYFVHYSTDYVFDGSGNSPWAESDRTAPLNVYGKTKLEGEQRIAVSCSRYLIFRTSWVYAARGNNFVKSILRLATERERLTIIDDQIGAPTGADIVADVTAHVIRAIWQHPEYSGLYHLVSDGYTSWYSYAKFIIDHALGAGALLKATVETVEPVPSSAFCAVASRPFNSRLNSSKLQSTFGLVLPQWQQGVSRLLSEIL